jgi:aryl-alcohol dehydrogenase-like predicted oxidoreductase
MHVTNNGELEERPKIIPGRAKPEAAADIPLKHPEWSHSYRPLGRTGLTTSTAGFGTYRVHHAVQTQRAALAKALRMGINIIDTSSNYAGGNSERLVGEVLFGLIGHSAVKREEVIVVSKGGYIQGELFDEMQRRANTPHADYSPGSELTEIVRHSQGLWHSIHPDFLRDQLTDSLERLQLETVDVYLLHNPEYYIEWAIAEGQAEYEVREEYIRRIKQAFAYLETEVAAGRIQWYGISSNTFPRPEEVIDRTSLERVWQSAEEVSKDHHFAVVQFPLNIFEPGAAVELNQKRGSETLLDFCAEKNLGVLINRPLNAIANKQLIRLADFPAREVPPEDDMDDLAHDLKLQEEEFVKVTMKKLPLDPKSIQAVENFLTLGRNLDEGNWRAFASAEEWHEIAQSVLAPRIQYVFDILRPLAKTDEGLFSFLASYAEAADEFLEYVSHYYGNRSHARSQKIHEAFDALMPEEYRPLSLSQKAVLLIRSLPEVSSVLVGMRTEEYVEDVVFGLQAKPVENIEEIWKRLAAIKENA